MSSPEPTGPVRSRSASQTFLGAALIAVGGLWLVNSTGIGRIDWTMVLAGALGVLGLALALGIGGRSAGGLVPLGFVLVALIFASYLIQPTWNFAPTVGERAFSPTNTTQMEGLYRHGVGSLEVDLSRVTFDEPAHVSASLGMGELVFIVPEDLKIEVRAGAGMGSVEVLGSEQSGIGPELNYRSDDIGRDDDVLTLDLSVGMGSVEVRR